MHPHRLRAPLAVLGTLQALDVWTTYVALHGGGREGNPVALAVLVAGGFAALALVKCAMFLNAARAAHRLTLRGRLQWALSATCVLSIIYCAVVASNTLHVVHGA